ncbi:MAG: HPF/RaiA family ribosome-associated protein [Planctomycetota bacterium]|nr:HPF/RaiA family ribosome-associated protein [Planctomycetota bacterium]MDA1162186.1 HPF/RaiA family ribosome-associated protein [Planctomycetota bacterium]
MRLSIRSHLIELTDDLRETVERRIYFALSRFGPRIERATVTLEDISGTRGGVVQRCRIVIKPQRGDELIVIATDADLHAAISFAADRAGRVVQRELERRRTDRRQMPRTPEAPAEPQDGTVSAD